jgi:hypothetical protein
MSYEHTQHAGDYLMQSLGIHVAHRSHEALLRQCHASCRQSSKAPWRRVSGGGMIGSPCRCNGCRYPPFSTSRLIYIYLFIYIYIYIYIIYIYIYIYPEREREREREREKERESMREREKAREREKETASAVGGVRVTERCSWGGESW